MSGFKTYDTTHSDKASISTTAYVPGSDAEKRLLRKIDRRIVPCVWILYTLSYLDRANIGNANSGGMRRDLKYNDDQYSIILLISCPLQVSAQLIHLYVFFISYVLFEVPANQILTRVRPSLWLSGLAFVWGGVAACMAACNSWQAIAGVRFVLGICEAGFAPGVAFYLSSWYKKHELARRYSIYYTATAVSGAFSGLLAGLITQHLEGKRGIAGWKWLLLIEGVGSSFVACFTWYFLADFPSTTRWLNADERILAAQRLASEEIGDASAEGPQPTHWQAFKQTVTEWRVLYLSIMYMLATGSQTIQYFIPALVGQLGYTGFDKQYMTIPIYAVAFVFILSFCFASDFKRERGFFIAAAAATSAICFIITVSVNNQHAKYAFLALAVGGVYACCPLTLMWTANVIAHPAEKRAIAIAVVNGLGNSASIYGSFLWPSKTGPRYVQGFATTTAFVGTLGIMAVIFRKLVVKYPYAAMASPTENTRFGGKA